MVPCFSVGLLFGLPDEGTSGLPWQGGIFVLASLVVLLLRWKARRAFDSPCRQRRHLLSEC